MPHVLGNRTPAQISGAKQQHLLAPKLCAYNKRSTFRVRLVIVYLMCEDSNF